MFSGGRYFYPGHFLCPGNFSCDRWRGLAKIVTLIIPTQSLPAQLSPIRHQNIRNCSPSLRPSLSIFFPFFSPLPVFSLLLSYAAAFRPLVIKTSQLFPSSPSAFTLSFITLFHLFFFLPVILPSFYAASFCSLISPALICFCFCSLFCFFNRSISNTQLF